MDKEKDNEKDNLSRKDGPKRFIPIGYTSLVNFMHGEGGIVCPPNGVFLLHQNASIPTDHVQYNSY